MAEPFEDLKAYVRGGGRLVHLVSRDLIRLEGACIKVSNQKHGSRRLMKWEETQSTGSAYDYKSEKWVPFSNHKEEPEDPLNPPSEIAPEFLQTFFGEDKAPIPFPESVEDFVNIMLSDDFKEDYVLYLPLHAPLINIDGDSGRRTQEVLQKNLRLSEWGGRANTLKNTITDSNRNESWTGKTIIISGFFDDIPSELRPMVHTIRWDFPTREEIYQLLTGSETNYEHGDYIPTLKPRRRGSILAEFGLLNYVVERDEEYFTAMWGCSLGDVVDAARGLDLQDCSIAIRSAIRAKISDTSSRRVDYQVKDQKVRILQREGLLKIEEPGTEEVQGLERLSEWIKDKAIQFTKPDLAEKHGLRPLKGLLLTGVPGCGKSMSVKSISRELQAPLLAFDLGTLMNRYVGKSEENMTRALKQAEGMAPCVLWIDEFEKMFASAGNSQSHEVTQRINASFLKWMEEKKESVFVVATSNDLSTIKAEYQRSGRWNSTFFFDLPSLFERKLIIQSQLERYQTKGGHSLTLDNIEYVAKKTEAWASSDVVELINQSKVRAFESCKDQGIGLQSKITMDHVQSVIDEEFVTPLSKRDQKRLNFIRNEGEKYTKASRYRTGDKRVPNPYPPKKKESE